MNTHDFRSNTFVMISLDCGDFLDTQLGYWAVELFICQQRGHENLDRIEHTRYQLVELLLHVMFEFDHDRNVVWLKNWDRQRLRWLFLDHLTGWDEEPEFTFRFKDVSDIDPETLEQYGFDAEGIRRPRTVEATHP